MERRLRPGLTDYGPLDENEQSPLRKQVAQQGGGGAGTPPAEATGQENYRPMANAVPNNRGINRFLTPADTQFQTVCETPKKAGQDAELISVVLGLDPQWRLFPPSPAPLKTPRISGQLDWGIGGASFSANFDWIQGTVLTVPANWVRAKAAYAPWIGFGTLPDVVIGAGFAYGGVGHSRAPARFSVDFGAAPTASAVVQVPPFATSFTIAGQTTAITPPNLSILVNGAGPLSALRFNYVDDTNLSNQNEGQYPLHNGADSIQITNNGAFTFNGVCIFTLAI